MFSLCSSVLLMSSVSIFITVTLNCFSDKLIWIIFAFIPRFISETLSYSLLWNIFCCLLIYPNFLCLFLCVRWITYVSWSWRSGLTQKVSCGAWKGNAASLSLIFCSLKVICKGGFCFVLGFLGIYPASCSVSFLDLWFGVWPLFGNFSVIIVSNISLLPVPLLFEYSHYVYIAHFIVASQPLDILPYISLCSRFNFWGFCWHSL